MQRMDGSEKKYGLSRSDISLKPSLKALFWKKEGKKKKSVSQVAYEDKELSCVTASRLVKNCASADSPS